MNRVWITAEGLAKQHGIPARKLRLALQAEGLRWHVHGKHWIARDGTQEASDMLRVVQRLAASKAA